MAIMFEGKVHRIKVFPGPEGKKRFEQEVRRLINLGDDEEFDIEFQCKSPLGGKQGCTVPVASHNKLQSDNSCSVALVETCKLESQDGPRAAALQSRLV
jgi:hypothetical protein